MTVKDDARHKRVTISVRVDLLERAHEVHCKRLGVELSRRKVAELALVEIAKSDRLPDLAREERGGTLRITDALRDGLSMEDCIHVGVDLADALKTE